MHLEAVRARIAGAAERSGRDPAAVRIVAVTKGHPLDTVRRAAAQGLLDIGENRVQEAFEKQDAWPDAPVRWHLIGHLQSNKARKAVGRFALIHSVDSIHLADELEKTAALRGLVQDVLVQVNVAREPQKTGVAPEEAEALAAHVAARPHLRLCGLMTMAPLTDDERVIRATFRGLKELGARCEGGGASRHDSAPAGAWALGPGGFELSMGMSGDFEIAVEEGATLLRLGTVLFGERP
jgi:pyridoxal phosphate enzyme (YggS family)